MNALTDHSRSPYRGRFAPSPTGPLHFGSLVTALGSYLQAKSQGGEWLVRMEDLDPPREEPGAADDILRTLEAFHLFWDGPVLFQSQRYDAYEAALEQLATQGQSFPCACSRKTIAKAMSLNPKKSENHPDIYPGTCREGLPPDAQARSIRVRAKPVTVGFEDGLHGLINTQLDREVGDFIIKRADGYYAYHLAVVVDDAYQGITEVVRGLDLIESTPHHLYLQQLLILPTPHYVHLPIAVNSLGEKLSKQTQATPVNTQHAGPTLVKALTFLGHAPDTDVIDGSPEELLEWALDHWDLAKVPDTKSIPVESKW